MTSYCDILGVRSFPGLVDRDNDYREEVLQSFVKNARCPVINLESSTLHPLQSLTDVFTIEEHRRSEKPKVVLTWAPASEESASVCCQFICSVDEQNGL